MLPSAAVELLATQDWEEVRAHLRAAPAGFGISFGLSWSPSLNFLFATVRSLTASQCTNAHTKEPDKMLSGVLSPAIVASLLSVLRLFVGPVSRTVVCLAVFQVYSTWKDTMASLASDIRSCETPNSVSLRLHSTAHTPTPVFDPAQPCVGRSALDTGGRRDLAQPVVKSKALNVGRFLRTVPVVCQVSDVLQPAYERALDYLSSVLPAHEFLSLLPSEVNGTGSCSLP